MNSKNSKAFITSAEIVSAYGDGKLNLINGLYSSLSAVKFHKNNPSALYDAYPVGLIPDVENHPVRLFNILRRLSKIAGNLPENAPLYLATTIGAIDILEAKALGEGNNNSGSHLHDLINFLKNCFGERKINLISGACAASNCAIAKASSDIAKKRINSAIILSCDAISEFIFSGFASLGALDQKASQPFDKNRAGLNLGEAASILVLKSPDIISDEKILGRIEGWGLSSDATHATSPDPEAKGLVSSIRTAINMAGISDSDISFIAAHGTGTPYNDSAEITAYQKIFTKVPPTFSTKWGTGHTIAAAGMLQLIVACHAKKVNSIPPNATTLNPEDMAKDWISPLCAEVKSDYALSVSSGFGGINSVLILS